ncbi:hypothetical protein [Hansschlegelia plantiphila]|uniref:Lectin-like protein BA14k n=1 Tax=Hansschlegelia plantiphila TaxID=374655 RepID=A0A9W6MV84_9HYPH|nr:hypothetical protein [Hansschlegelia plantiphila]GLK67677.1 hypothetical protein GCM10008179_13150 [Hansschlegelia plantiphila]
MFRNLALAATLAAGGFAAAPAPASAGIYVDAGGGYGGYYRHRPYYGGGYYRPRPYGYYAPRYRPRPYGYYRPAYRPACRLVTTRFWNGYRYVTRTREDCRRRYY